MAGVKSKETETKHSHNIFTAQVDSVVPAGDARRWLH